jgi:hypothetical protein
MSKPMLENLFSSVPPFNVTFPATATTIATMLLPKETVDQLGNPSTAFFYRCGGAGAA